MSGSEGLSSAVASGDRGRALRALRDRLATEIEGSTSSRDVAALSRQLTDVLAQIEALEKAQPEQKGSPLDELAKRRAARPASAAGGAGS